MLCFGFTYAAGASCENLSVELCEEFLQYSPDREDGILITTNLVVKSKDPVDKFLGVWHRRHVGPFSVAATEHLLSSEDLCTQIFCNITPKRGVHLGEREMLVRLFRDRTDDRKEYEFRNGPRVPSMASGVSICVPTLDSGRDGFRITDPMRTELDLVPETLALRPYTYGEIGPFRYGIRVTAKVDENAFDSLVIEDHIELVRVYEVYGTNTVLKKIHDSDIPALHCSGLEEKIVGLYRSRFQGSLNGNRALPDYYSVVAVRSPKTKELTPNERLHAAEMREGLEELQVDESLYEHEGLEGFAKGDVLWFVNRKRQQDFRLQLLGPMFVPAEV